MLAQARPRILAGADQALISAARFTTAAGHTESQKAAAARMALACELLTEDAR